MMKIAFFLLLLCLPACAESLKEIRQLMADPATLPEARRLAQEATKSENPLQAQDAAFLMAECDYRLGQIDLAFYTLESLSLRAQNSELRPEALFRLAMLQMEQQRTDAALASYEAIALRFPNSPYAPVAIMVQGNYALLVKGNKGGAIGFYERLAKTYPESEEAKLALSALPDLRKMGADQVRKLRDSFLKDLEKARKKAAKKK